MAIGVRCETCGAEVPSLGSLQMHQLRYHPGSSASPDAVTASVGSAASIRNGRRRAVAPLAVAIAGLLSGGAFAITIRLVG